MPKVPLEHTEAVHFARWCKYNDIDAWHIPNETFTPYHSVKNRNKAAGVKSGIADYLVYLNADQTPNKQAKLIWIELKRQKKSLSNVKDSQKDFLEKMNTVSDCFAFIAYGALEAMFFVEKYWNGKKTPKPEVTKQDVDDFKAWLHKEPQ